ncbi:MAG: alpha/beta hydrolase [Burkholderiales bacterium]|nr:alpha/beta hydrolase [Burkholderiales bacterium]
MIPNLPLDELARRYNNGAAVPDWQDTLLPRWQRGSDRVRREAGGARDVAYGPLPRNRFDVFTPPGASPPGGWPTLCFIHGGYWQRLYKDDWSVIAQPFVANGMAAVIVGYTLCPQTTIRGIAAEIETAVAHAWQHAPALGIARERVALVGHSAGGHLTAWCLTTDWTARGLPATPFVAATAISGLFDLEPLVPIYLNEALQLGNDEALAMSPAYRERRVDCDLTAAVGGAELDEFLRQNALIGQAWAGVREWTLPGLNHFSIIDQLTREDTELFAHVAKALR